MIKKNFKTLESVRFIYESNKKKSNLNDNAAPDTKETNNCILDEIQHPTSLTNMTDFKKNK